MQNQLSRLSWDGIKLQTIAIQMIAAIVSKLATMLNCLVTLFVPAK